MTDTTKARKEDKWILELSHGIVISSRRIQTCVRSNPFEIDWTSYDEGDLFCINRIRNEMENAVTLVRIIEKKRMLGKINHLDHDRRNISTWLLDETKQLTSEIEELEKELSTHGDDMHAHPKSREKIATETEGRDLPLKIKEKGLR